MKLRTQAVAIVLSVVVVAVVVDSWPREEPDAQTKPPPRRLDPDAPLREDTGPPERVGKAGDEAGQNDVATHGVTAEQAIDPEVTEGAPHPGIVPYLSGEHGYEAIAVLRKRVLRTIETDAELCRALDWLTTAEDSRVRLTAGRSLLSAIPLGAQLDYDVLPAAERLTVDPEKIVRISLAGMLGAGDTSIHRRLLFGMAEDPHPDVRTAVRKEIGFLLDPDSPTTVAKLLSATTDVQEAWYGQAITAVATATSDRFASVDVPIGVHTSVALPGPAKPTALWIIAGQRPGRGGVPTPPGSDWFMIQVAPAGAPAPADAWVGTGSTVEWPYLGGGWSTQGDVSFRTWTRELPGGKARFWIRSVDAKKAMAGHLQLRRRAGRTRVGGTRTR